MNKKIKTREDATEIVANLKEQKKIIGFTSGVFDILHAGHVDYLEKAKQLCDCLIVALNSDESTKKNKGPQRPINKQEERAKVVAALESVDYVFVFEEQNNQENIRAIRPNIYIKAGDYDFSKLSSKPLVESYGGKVEIIPLKENKSTTDLISKMSSVELPLEENKKIKAVFLDRDGTINEDVSYLHEPEKFSFTENAVEGLKKIQELGFRLIIITMQSGIGLGYFSKEDFFKVNSYMFKQLSPKGIKIDKIYFCPHKIADNCNCRKPKIGLVQRAFEDYEGRIDINKSFLIGDKTSDIKCGKDAGLKTFLVETGKAGKDGEYSEKPDYQAANLLEVANTILSLSNKLK